MKGYIDYLRKYQKVPVKHYPSQVPENPWVSICVQTYQHAQFLRECLDGILMQETDFDYEILLGEDASTDGTRKICIEYVEKYPEKIRLFLHSRENNIAIGGQPTGRFNFIYNLCQSQGKYITLCEGDDYWTDRNKLQYQVQFLETHREYASCFHKVNLLHGNTLKEDGLNKNIPETTEVYDLIRKNYIRTCSCIFRKEGIDNLPDSFVSSPVGDYYLHLLVAKVGKLKFMDRVMGVYRQHEESYWQSQPNYDRIVGMCETRLKLLGKFDESIEHINQEMILVDLQWIYNNTTEDNRVTLADHPEIRLLICAMKDNRLYRASGSLYRKVIYKVIQGIKRRVTRNR